MNIDFCFEICTCTQYGLIHYVAVSLFFTTLFRRRKNCLFLYFPLLFSAYSVRVHQFQHNSQFLERTSFKEKKRRKTPSQSKTLTEKRPSKEKFYVKESRI